MPRSLSSKLCLSLKSIYVFKRKNNQPVWLATSLNLLNLYIYFEFSKKVCVYHKMGECLFQGVCTIYPEHLIQKLVHLSDSSKIVATLPFRPENI